MGEHRQRLPDQRVCYLVPLTYLAGAESGLGGGPAGPHFTAGAFGVTAGAGASGAVCAGAGAGWDFGTVVSCVWTGAGAGA